MKISTVFGKEKNKVLADKKVNKTIKKNALNTKKEDSINSLFQIKSEKAQEKEVRVMTNLDLHNYGKQEDDNGVVAIVNDLIVDALAKSASDIHIEPREENIIVRFRVDGEFIEYKNLGINLKESLIARLKIMALLRIDEQRLPQDGKINFVMFGGKTLDMRVSVIPTIYGEKCVIRLLKKDETPPDLKTLGILPYNMVKIKKALKYSHGMILAVGPTGSGKSTTLFSLLSQYNPKKKNIATLEDPVEYRIPGVNHTQINPAINFTFAEGLRSLLRQDPDIIMVGEIRDEETSKLAVEASITGHMVFSTLHTNSATHTIQRLVNLGVDPLLISSSLRFIVSQRLARKLCTHCKEGYTPDEKVISKIVGKVGRYMKEKDNITLYKPKEGGCKKCNNTGFKGRVGLYEILEMTDKLEALLLKNASKTQLEIQAIGDGMVPIVEDGLLKVVIGETSLEEVLSVLGGT